MPDAWNELEAPSLERMFCHQCGYNNPPGSRSCSSCGATLALAPGDDTTMTIPLVAGEEGEAEGELRVSVEDLPTGFGVLVTRQGPSIGSRYVLDAEVTRVGRHPDSDIVLDDMTISRHHAEVMRRADGYTVRDYRSRTGTYVNRERVAEMKLANGDELQLGRVKLIFFCGVGGSSGRG